MLLFAARLVWAQAAPSTPLDAEALVAEVWAHAPAVASAEAAVLVAIAEKSAARRRPSPRLEAMVAPGSFGSDHADPGVTVTLSQMFAPPGAVSRTVDAASARRDRAEGELDAVRQAVALEAVGRLFALWRLDRAIAATEAHEALLVELAEAARARYAAGDGSLQDPLEAELEAVALATERVAMRAERAGMLAELNALRGAALDAEIVPAEPGPVPSLGRPVRPERAAAAAGIAAAEAEVRAMRAENRPELGVSAQYSSMWPMPAHRTMVGAEAELPLGWGARAAGVDRAEAEAGMARADAEAVDLEVGVDAAAARAALAAADELLALARDRRLPLARERLAAARQGYVAGSADFPAVIDAARAQLDAELALADAIADRAARAAAATRAEEAP